MAPDHPGKAIPAAAEDLQKSLGIMNDAVLALRLADELAQERDAIPVAALAPTDASRDGRPRLAKEWPPYRRQKRFWC